MSESPKKSDKTEYARQYYQKNKEKHLAYMKHKVKCDRCENMIQRCYLPKHKRTNVCQRVADNNKRILEKALDFIKKHNLQDDVETLDDIKQLM